MGLTAEQNMFVGLNPTLDIGHKGFQYILMEENICVRQRNNMDSCSTLPRYVIMVQSYIGDSVLNKFFISLASF